MNNETNKIEGIDFMYSLMSIFSEYKVVFYSRATLCVGGVTYNPYTHALTLYKDFFNKQEIPLFTNEYGEFVAKRITCTKIYNASEAGYEERIDVHRTDGVMSIYCAKPDAAIVDIEVDTIWDLCNESIVDHNESCEINGVYYNVTNPAKINQDLIPQKAYNEIREILDADNFKDNTLKFYFVRSFEQKKFYVGLWDAVVHRPVNFDISGKGNSDYSKVYELLF